MPTEKEYKATIKDLQQRLEKKEAIIDELEQYTKTHKTKIYFITTSLLKMGRGLWAYGRLDQQLLTNLKDVKFAYESLSHTHDLLLELEVDKRTSNRELKVFFKNMGVKIENVRNYLSDSIKIFGDDLEEFNTILESILDDVPEKLKEIKSKTMLL